jgi:nondiscriminating aspartyl-tRNA synthetase
MFIALKKTISKFNSNYLFHCFRLKIHKHLYSDTQMEQSPKLTEEHFNFVKDESDPLKDKYGVLPFIQSKGDPERRFDIKWTSISELSVANEGEKVKMRVRLQRSRIKGKGGFLILREAFSTLQGCLFVTENSVSEGMIKFAEKLSLESIVDVEGSVRKAVKPVESCTQQLIELDITSLFLVAAAQSVLPFQMEDANRKCNPEDEDDEVNTTVTPTTVSAPETVNSNTSTTTNTSSSSPCISSTSDEALDKKEKKKKEKEAKAQAKAQAQSKAQANEKKAIIVKMKTRLDNRVLDLRVPATQAIMRLQSGVGQLFREFLYKNNFVEIHTPKLIAGASEGGTNVFKMKYFELDACLAQSPQLYKQMAVIGDMEKVFEIGPVFRAENSNTPRHLCEFEGLDIEMAIKEHYFEVLDVLHDLFYYIFLGLNERYSHELNVVANQYPFEPLKFSKKSVRLNFKEGVELLKAYGANQDVNEDLDTLNEALLGKIVKEKYDTDFYILYGYPKSARPFYTMPDPEDENFTNSYDAFIRGEEVLSGAQRVHSYDLLLSKVLEKKINPETLKDYINAFKLGAPPHGGAGIGLERVVKLFTGLKNIKKCVMFPRDPKRLTP